MAAPAISCGECAWPVPAEFWNREQPVRCGGCGQNLRVLVFPAIRQARSGAVPEALDAETEASCFYHPGSRAAVLCAECGRFLCPLCDLEMDRRHLCPVCLRAGLHASKLENVETRRTMYDTVALALATFPALLFWPVILSAPAALWVVIRRWRAPGSLVPRTRVRFYLAALMAVAELAGIVFVVWAILQSSRRTGAL